MDVIPSVPRTESIPLPSGQPKPGINLRQLLVSLRRRWRLVALAWVGTVAAAGIYLVTATPLYRP